MGVGSEVYGAITNGRKGFGAELKPTYFRQAQKNLRSAPEVRGEENDLQGSLFDMVEATA